MTSVVKKKTVSKQQQFVASDWLLRHLHEKQTTMNESSEGDFSSLAFTKIKALMY